jgi:hypothetical protein
VKLEPAGQYDGRCGEDEDHGVDDPLTNHVNSSRFSVTATRDIYITSAVKKW